MTRDRNRFEIRELIDHSMIRIDQREYDGYSALYTASGHYESPFAQAAGPEEISAMSRRLTESGFTEGYATPHSPISIQVDVDTATAISYFWVVQVNDAPTVFATGTLDLYAECFG